MNPNSNNKNIINYVALTIGTIGGLLLAYFSYRIALAEYLYGKALQEAAANRGNTTYTLMQDAIRQQPFQISYRLSYSKINLALANSIASKDKEQITDQDRNDIQQLVSQAIREARNAVALNPLMAASWENLSDLYRNLINVAQGADAWAIGSYQQAIILDPNNPQLRLTFGQLLYSLKQYENAQRQFEIAASLKPDFANAYFNLAASYQAQEKWQLAKRTLEITLNLVDADSEDFQTVKKELDKVEERIAELGSATESAKFKEQIPSPRKKPITPTPALQTPEEASPATSLEPKLELPAQEYGPQITTTPIPTVSPSPTATSTPSPTPEK